MLFIKQTTHLGICVCLSLSLHTPSIKLSLSLSVSVPLSFSNLTTLSLSPIPPLTIPLIHVVVLDIERTSTWTNVEYIYPKPSIQISDCSVSYVCSVSVMCVVYQSAFGLRESREVVCCTGGFSFWSLHLQIDSIK